MTSTATATPARNAPHGMLYISRLAAGLGPAAVSAVFREARHRMPALQISGVLLFDGERFAQWLQGPRPELEALLGHAAGDKRHQDLQVLFDAPCDAGWLATGGRSGAARWLSGWAPPDGLAALEMLALTAPAGAADAVKALQDLLPACDLL